MKYTYNLVEFFVTFHLTLTFRQILPHLIPLFHIPTSSYIQLQIFYWKKSNTKLKLKPLIPKNQKTRVKQRLFKIGFNILSRRRQELVNKRFVLLPKILSWSTIDLQSNNTKQIFETKTQDQDYLGYKWLQFSFWWLLTLFQKVY